MSDNINHTLYQELKDDDLSFVYLGKFENSILGFATEILKGHMTLSDDSEGKKNKLSFLMIESFQNILLVKVVFWLILKMWLYAWQNSVQRQIVFRQVV